MNDLLKGFADSKNMSYEEGIKYLISLYPEFTEDILTDEDKALKTLQILMSIGDYVPSVDTTQYDGILKDLPSDIAQVFNLVTDYDKVEFIKSHETLFDKNNWLYLMHEDTPVLKFTLDYSTWIILENELLPLYLRDRLYNVESIADLNFEARVSNLEIFKGYAASRMLTMDRLHAKAILGHWHLAAELSPYDKAAIAVSCNLLTVEDKYWLCGNPSKVKWADVDLRTQPTHKVIIALALQGRSSLFKSAIPITEFTTKGIFPKAWCRENNWLYLLKGPIMDYPKSVDIEVAVSNILDVLKIQHIKYEKSFYDGMPVCKCRNMTTDKLSRVTASEVQIYAKYHNKTVLDFVKDLNDPLFYKMCIIDYLISNTDRHFNNWGFYFDDRYCDLVSLHPLFDHNLSFDSKALFNDNYESYIFPNMSLYEVARLALKRVDFPDVSKVTRNLFVAKEHYESFREKCNKLKLL